MLGTRGKGTRLSNPSDILTCGRHSLLSARFVTKVLVRNGLAAPVQRIWEPKTVEKKLSSGKGAPTRDCPLYVGLGSSPQSLLRSSTDTVVKLCFNSTDSITLPAWVLELGRHYPDIFYTDKAGSRSRECLTLGVDDVPVLHGRTGQECYDQSMLATLKASAEHAEPMWGLGGPHDAGQYKEWPQQCGFFTQKGNWRSSYGRFFLQWYSEMLIRHALLVMGAASAAFSGTPVRLSARIPSCHWWSETDSHAAELTARAVAAALHMPVCVETRELMLDDALLVRMEDAIFKPISSLGIELPPVDGLVMNSMCDAMFEPEGWQRFSSFVNKVATRFESETPYTAPPKRDSLKEPDSHVSSRARTN
ncbi:glycoside hydrolase superfamily [Dunaliella salina]|uniref:Beta-amylase n=1 Tax=Dunaliella salina TaxID=3046 RepID=A0ABZ3LC09_DUNSA|nr:glycoside hydrolase superfamily [Dunaliella salina]|eukprot:KAF5838957.1 glycoside hydrolase superfamily [Dunaliella salina]